MLFKPQAYPRSQLDAQECSWTLEAWNPAVQNIMLPNRLLQPYYDHPVLQPNRNKGSSGFQVSRVHAVPGPKTVNLTIKAGYFVVFLHRTNNILVETQQ